MSSQINSSSNNSQAFGTPPSEPTTGDYVLTVFFAILIFVILVGNSLVLGSFRVNRRLRTKTNYFILSLAFADLLIGILSVPYYVKTIISKIPDEYYFVWLTIDVMIGVSSIMNLTMISLERAYALLRPIQHRSISKVTILIMIAAAWALGILACTLRFMLHPAIVRKIYGIIVFSVFFAVPLTIIIVTYAIIFKIASAHAHGRGVRSFKKDLRIATTIAVVIGFFTVAWLPFFSLNLFFTVCITLGGRPLCMTVPAEILYITKFMQYGNSACNPIIYGFRNKDFKITFKKIIYKIIGKDVPIRSYTQSTYVTKHNKRMLRSESSFDESMVYPDQIVPPGMYDMRDSYRSAIAHGPRKKTAKTNTQQKGLAQGLMSLNVEALSMPTSQSASAMPTELTTETSQSADINCNTAVQNDLQGGVESSLDIEVYPIDRASRDKGANNDAFVQSQENVTKAKRHAKVHFGNGVVNGGLSSDEGETKNDQLSISLEKERSNSLLTSNSFNKNDSKGNQRSLSLT